MLPLLTAAASCAAAGCGGIAAAALRRTLLPSPLLGCSRYPYLIRCFLAILCASILFFCAVSLHIATSPLIFEGRLQDFVYLERKRTKIMMARGIHVLSRKEGTFSKIDFRKTL